MPLSVARNNETIWRFYVHFATDFHQEFLLKKGKYAKSNI
jgi:hypothetical protein